MRIFSELKILLENHGADMVGYSGISNLSIQYNMGYKTAITIGLDLDKDIIKEIITGPVKICYSEWGC